MSIAEIQQAIMDLPKADYVELIRWLGEWESDEWEQQIEEHSLDGKLDFLIAEAAEAKEQGTLRDI